MDEVLSGALEGALDEVLDGACIHPYPMCSTYGALNNHKVCLCGGRVMRIATVSTEYCYRGDERVWVECGLLTHSRHSRKQWLSEASREGARVKSNPTAKGIYTRSSSPNRNQDLFMITATLTIPY